MFINNRQFKILERLSKEQQPVQLQQLAAELAVSLRTIQNDVNRINYFLELYQLAPLKRSSRGYTVAEDEEEKLTVFLDGLYKSEAKDLILTPEERMELIYLRLLQSCNYVKISVLAEDAGVSKATLMNDLNQLRQELQDWSVEIAADRNGIKLFGDEHAIREFALGRYMDEADDSCVYEASDYYRASIWIRYRLAEVRSFKDTQILHAELRWVEKELGRNFTTHSFLAALTWLELAIERIRGNNIARMDEDKLGVLLKSAEFKAACKLAWNLSKALKIRFPLEEIAHLAIRFMACNDARINHPVYVENFAELQVEICKLIHKIGHELQTDFSGISSLYNHLVFLLRPLVYRVKNGIKIKNPLLPEIRRQYPILFNAVKKNTGEIEKLIGAPISEDELAYITIHFASIMEPRWHIQNPRPNVLLVCDAGIGTSNLLMAKITSMYEVNVVDIVTYDQLENALVNHQADYILSTAQISHDRVPVIKVSPLISERDKALLNPHFQPKFTRQLDFDQLMSILERNCTIRDRDQLIKDLSEAYPLFTDKNGQKEDDKMLKDVVDQEMIELDFPARDWEEAVRRTGLLLKKGGCIEDRYIESMVRVVKSMGAYIVIGKGIALPHSRSTEGARKVGISFLRLAEPIAFGHPENDPVDLLFGLASVDNKSHIHALRDLTQVLTDANKVEKLRAASSKEEVLAVLTGEGEEK
jgi:mannitol operon transcriptional antiterminator